MYYFLRTASGAMTVVAVIAVAAFLIDYVSEFQRMKKAAKQGQTFAKRRPIVRIIAISAAVVMVAGSVIVDKIAANLKSEETSPKASSSGVTSHLATPTKYEKMQSEIVLHLNRHNDTSSAFDSVTVEQNNGKVEFNILLEAYETYTFASVTSAATDIVRELVEEYGVDEYRLWVHSPPDAAYTISWISFNLDAGTIDDKGSGGRYNETIKLDLMLKHYGYEDYEGSLQESRR